MARRTGRVLPAIAILVSGAFVTSCGGDSSSGGGGGSLSSDEFCELIADIDEADPFANLDSSATPEETQEAFESIDDTLNGLYKAAPDEIKADIKTVVDIYGEMISLFEAADWDVMAIDFEAFDAIDTTEVDAASERLDAWETSNCK